MRIYKLRIKNFLSFKDFEWENIDPHLNIIVGPNGSGKTNLFNAFRAFADLLNDSTSSELIQQIKSFTHFGNQASDIEIRMHVEFEEEEKQVLLAYVRASLVASVSNRGFQFDELTDEELLNFIKLEDIADLFRGDLIAEYDFFNGRWNTRYEGNSCQLLIDGSWGGYMISPPKNEGLTIQLRDKFADFLKSHFHQEHLQQHITQLGTKISVNGGPSDALQMSLHSNSYNLKPLVIFQNMIKEIDRNRGYSLRNLYGWLLRREFVFTDNIRELPKTTFSSKELEEAMGHDALNSRNIAYLLHRLKNGNLAERTKFSSIKSNFKDLTEGLDFDISEVIHAEALQVNRIHNLGEGVGLMTPMDHIQEEKRDISISLNLQVIKDANEFPLRYSGAGTWEALYFSCLMETEGNIFFLDEPVANVHPNRQKLFTKKFKINTGGQLFISTHSPYVTGFEDIQKISRFDLDPEKKETVRHFYPEKMDKKISGILSRSRSSIGALFSRGVILVEGPTEFMALPKWFFEYFGGSLEDKNIVLVHVGGKDSFVHYLKFLHGFRIPWAVLCDGDAIKSDPYNRTLAAQLVTSGVEKKLDLESKTFEQRKEILKKYGVFTVAKNENEKFESIKVFSGSAPKRTSKPDRGIEVASKNTCPDELKLIFNQLQNLPIWINILTAQHSKET